MAEGGYFYFVKRYIIWLISLKGIPTNMARSSQQVILGFHFFAHPRILLVGWSLYLDSYAHCLGALSCRYDSKPGNKRLFYEEISDFQNHLSCNTCTYRCAFRFHLYKDAFHSYLTHRWGRHYCFTLTSVIATFQATRMYYSYISGWLLLPLT